jgi:hypothetical protein
LGCADQPTHRYTGCRFGHSAQNPQRQCVPQQSTKRAGWGCLPFPKSTCGLLRSALAHGRRWRAGAHALSDRQAAPFASVAIFGLATILLAKYHGRVLISGDFSAACGPPKAPSRASRTSKLEWESAAPGAANMPSYLCPNGLIL